MFSYLITLFLFFNTFPYVTYGCNAPPGCEDVGLTKDFVSEYSPHVQWTYQTDKSLRISGQASSENEAQKKLSADIKKVIDDIRGKYGGHLDLKSMELLDIGSSTVIGEFHYVNFPSKCELIECTSDSRVSWGSESDDLNVILQSQSGSGKFYYALDNYTYKSDEVQCDANGNKKKNGVQEWLPLKIRISFNKTPGVQKLCSVQWDELMKQVLEGLNKNFRVRDMSWE
uniref:Uncharacterized protein n=1 Tax=Parastrongyloides trichosuri TaxID=131310 RepID=A0A0N4ZI50_PARTI